MAATNAETRARESLAALLDTLHSDRLARLRRECAAAGITAESPDHLDADTERLAREERWTER